MSVVVAIGDIFRQPGYLKEKSSSTVAPEA